MNDRVDIHSHYLPQFYRQALADAGIVHPDGMARVPDWSPEAALATMDSLGVRTACVSVSSPGVRFAGCGDAIAMARRLNRAGADLVEAHPERFRFFATTPLPDVDAALAEIRHSFDELGASGVVFETNFDGVYLGDDALEPIYRELDAREAIVFIHPTSPHCGCGAAAGCGPDEDRLALGYPAPMLEFMFETTRTVTQLILSGTLKRHPRLRVMVRHAGACLPVLAGRIGLLQGAGPTPRAPVDVRAALSNLHFDLAGSPVPEALEALLHIARPAHLHYGSDWPFTPLAGCRTLLDALAATTLLSHADREAMFGGNARGLLGM